jgi:hypothetical protein
MHGINNVKVEPSEFYLMMALMMKDGTYLHKYEQFSMYCMKEFYCEVLISVPLEQHEN